MGRFKKGVTGIKKESIEAISFSFYPNAKYSSGKSGVTGRKEEEEEEGEGLKCTRL